MLKTKLKFFQAIILPFILGCILRLFSSMVFNEFCATQYHVRISLPILVQPLRHQSCEHCRS